MQTVQIVHIRMPELLDELGIAKAGNEFKKVVGTYRNVNLLILGEWLIRCLTPEESYNLFETIEARSQHGSTIFCIGMVMAAIIGILKMEPELFDGIVG